MVDELLSLSLSQGAVVEVTLDIDIEECRNSTDGHCSAVLGLDSSQIAEVCPLNSLACVCSRLGDIAAVGSSHNLHLLECADLVSQLLTLTDNGISHLTVAAVSEIVLLSLNESVDTVEGDSSVVAYDTATAIGIGKTGDDLVLSYCTHLRGVSVEYALVVCLVIFCEDLVQLRIGGVAVSCASLFSHLDTAVGHESSLEGLISLKTNDLLKILHLRINVAGLVRSDAGYDVGIHIENTALSALLLLKLLNLAPQLVGGVSRASEEGLVAVVRGVVVLDEVACVYLFLPDLAFEAFPLFENCHLSKYLHIILDVNFSRVNA